MAKRILFQGDSITDCGRNKQDFYNMGGGYANLIKGQLGADKPNEYEFINRASVAIELLTFMPELRPILSI